MTEVKKDESVFSFHDQKLGENTTASVGFGDRLRPAVSVQYDKMEDSVAESGRITTESTRLQATAALGKPVSVSGYRSWETNYPQENGNTLKMQGGVGANWTYGSSPEVVAAIRGDYIRQEGEGISPYFKALASGGPATPPSARLEVGACMKPYAYDLEVPNTCVGVSRDTNGQTKVGVSIGYNF
ncbi:MAG: hypothetical protein ACK4NR_05085 [Micavibrio sp.]